MSEHLARISMHGTTLGGSFDNEVIITGYVDKFEPGEPAKRDVLRPVEPDEPDTKIEVGYSKNALEPLTLSFCARKIELTESAYILLPESFGGCVDILELLEQFMNECKIVKKPIVESKVKKTEGKTLFDDVND